MVIVTQEKVTQYLMIAQYMVPILQGTAKWTETKWDDNAAEEIKNAIMAAMGANLDPSFARLLDHIVHILIGQPHEVKEKMQKASEALTNAGFGNTV